MRLVALVLLLANLLAWAWWQGLLGVPARERTEPQRVAAQMAPERLRLLSAAELDAARERSRRQGNPLAAIDFSAGTACLELGDFAEPAASDLRERAAALGLGDRLALRDVQSPGWTLVVLPPSRTRADGERQVAASRKQGARGAWLIEEAGALRWAVALGAFRTGEAARLHLAVVEKLGLKGARVVPAPATVPALRLRIEAADAALGAQLAALGGEFPGGRLAVCEK